MGPSFGPSPDSELGPFGSVFSTWTALVQVSKNCSNLASLSYMTCKLSILVTFTQHCHNHHPHPQHTQHSLQPHPPPPNATQAKSKAVRKNQQKYLSDLIKKTLISPTPPSKILRLPNRSILLIVYARLFVNFFLILQPL